MYKTKKYFSDRTISGLQDSYPQIDWKIQEREVWLVVDDIVNGLAKDNYLENWKLYGAMSDEAFITEWSGTSAIAVVDSDEQSSYIVLPADRVALSMNGGIAEVWPESYEYGAVKLMRHEDIRRTRNLMSGNLQGELGGYPSGNKFIFNQVNVGKNFAPTFGVRLVIKDSTAIGISDPYPVPADMVETVIEMAIEYFTKKRLSPTDEVRDNNDKA